MPVLIDNWIKILGPLALLIGALIWFGRDRR